MLLIYRIPAPFSRHTRVGVIICHSIAFNGLFFLFFSLPLWDVWSKGNYKMDIWLWYSSGSTQTHVYSAIGRNYVPYRNCPLFPKTKIVFILGASAKTMKTDPFRCQETAWWYTPVRKKRETPTISYRCQQLDAAAQRKKDNVFEWPLNYSNSSRRRESSSSSLSVLFRMHNSNNFCVFSFAYSLPLLSEF